MGVDLHPEREGVEPKRCNWWNWRPTVEIIRRSALLGDDTRCDLLSDGIGEVSALEAVDIGQYLRDEFLPRLDDESRVMLNLEVTRELTTERSTGRIWRKTTAPRCPG